MRLTTQLIYYHIILEYFKFPVWLGTFIILSLLFVMCGGCTGNYSPAQDTDPGLQRNLSELIMVRDYDHGHGAGNDDQLVIRYYHRQTGKRINVNHLIIGNVDDHMILATAFKEGLAVCRQIENGALGYVDEAGRMVIPFQFSQAEPFNEGRARVSIADNDGSMKWGLIDQSGKWIVSAGRYEELGQFSNGRCAFRVGKQWGLLDALGNVVVAPRFAAGPIFSCGLAAIGNDASSFVYIDRYGQVKVKAPDNAVAIYAFHNGVARFAIHSPKSVNEPVGSLFAKQLYGYISVAGKIVASPEFRQAADISEGLAAVSRNASVAFQDDIDPMEFTFEQSDTDKWGYLDVSGKIAIPFQFERAGHFSNGLARVRQNKKWGYIDKTGKFVIEPRFTWARDFHDGIAEVWHKGKIVFVDRTGSIVLETELPAVTF